MLAVLKVITPPMQRWKRYENFGASTFLNQIISGKYFATKLKVRQKFAISLSNCLNPNSQPQNNLFTSARADVVETSTGF